MTYFYIFIMVLDYDITGRDAISSLRQVLKRYCGVYSSFLYNNNPDGSTLTRVQQICLPTIMPPPGYVLSAYDGLDLSGLNLPVNYTNLTFKTYLAMAFALARGSERMKFVLQTRLLDNSGSPAGFVSSVVAAPTMTSVERFYDRADSKGFSNITRRREFLIPPMGYSTFSNVGLASLAWRKGQNYSEGAQVGLAGTEPSTFDIEFPFVSCLRAYNPRLPLSNSSDMREMMNMVVTAELPSDIYSSSSNQVPFHILGSVGEDFNLFYFLHAPTLLEYNPIGTAGP